MREALALPVALVLLIPASVMLGVGPTEADATNAGEINHTASQSDNGSDVAFHVSLFLLDGEDDTDEDEEDRGPPEDAGPPDDERGPPEDGGPPDRDERGPPDDDGSPDEESDDDEGDEEDQDRSDDDDGFLGDIFSDDDTDSDEEEDEENEEDRETEEDDEQDETDDDEDGEDEEEDESDSDEDERETEDEEDDENESEVKDTENGDNEEDGDDSDEGDAQFEDDNRATEGDGNNDDEDETTREDEDDRDQDTRVADGGETEDASGERDEREDEDTGTADGDGHVEDSETDDADDVSTTSTTPPPSPTATSTPTATPTSTQTPREAVFEVSMATVSDTEVSAGETVQVALRVENLGDRDGTYEAALTVDGEAVASKSVPVEAGDSAAIVFERRFDNQGEHEITVGGVPLGTVTVTNESETTTVTTPSSDETSTGIEVTEAIAPADWVRDGHETTVRVTVVNNGEQTATRTLTVTIGGQSVVTESVTLQPDERKVVRIGFQPADGTVKVDGVEAGRIEVGETGAVATTDTDRPAEDGGPGTESILAVLVTAVGTLAGAAGHFAKRNQ